MPSLSTHVLDTAHGRPAAGMAVRLFRHGEAEPIKTVTLNADGRADRPLLTAEEGTTGRYRLEFAVADYFRAMGVALPEPPFLDRVSVDFGVAEHGHYHVPLLVSPYGHATYRGS